MNLPLVARKHCVGVQSWLVQLLDVADTRYAAGGGAGLRISSGHISMQSRLVVLGDLTKKIRVLQVVTLDMGLLVAGTKYRGEFEERLKKLMEEIKQNSDIILVRVWRAGAGPGRLLMCRSGYFYF